jgi:hypothetical protein
MTTLFPTQAAARRTAGSPRKAAPNSTLTQIGTSLVAMAVPSGWPAFFRSLVDFAWP